MGLSGGGGVDCAACRHQSGRTGEALDLAPRPGAYLRVDPLSAAVAVAVVRFAGETSVKLREDPEAFGLPSANNRHSLQYGSACLNEERPRLKGGAQCRSLAYFAP